LPIGEVLVTLPLGQFCPDTIAVMSVTTQKIRTMKAIRHLLLVILIVTGASFARAQGESPYTEGSVWDVTMVKTKSGLSDDYLKQLKSIFVDELDAAKKEGMVLSYKILLGNYSTPQDYDVMLMVEYKNFAAFDGLRAKFDAIDKKLFGGADEERKSSIKRLEIREIMGEKLMQEVTLK
jgi:hypothetical protein